MKDLLNERIIKRYCYRIHITNEKQYLPPPPPPPPFIGNNPLYGIPSIFTKKS